MKKLLLVVGVGLMNFSYANSALLDKFLTHAQSVTANFTQKVVTNKKVQVSQGVMEIARPNKFRWDYPHDKQSIISDGVNIYIYDQPLNQVTIKKLGKSLDRSPASLLAGSNQINQLYQVKDLKVSDSKIRWVKITPKEASENNGFKEVLMGFDKEGLINQMKFTDLFGTETLLEFSNVKLGTKIPETQFKFTPPSSADVAYQ